MDFSNFYFLPYCLFFFFSLLITPFFLLLAAVETSIVIGIVVGLCVAILLLLGVGFLFWYRKTSRRKYELNEEANVRESTDTVLNLPFYAPTTANELKSFQDRPISSSSKRPASSNSSKRLSRPLSVSSSQTRPPSIPKTRRTKGGTESLL